MRPVALHRALSLRERDIRQPAVKARASPRYQEIAEELIAWIHGGAYPVGSQLPSETELCARYSVSRFTVRSALSLLQKKGYISRKPKIGTVVIASQEQSRFGLSVSSTADLLQYSRSTPYRILEVRDVVADHELARELECEEGEPWVRISACRISAQSSQPLSLIDYYIHPEHRVLVPEIKGTSGPLYARIERLAGTRAVEMRQKFTAHLMSRQQAKALEVQAGSAALRVVYRIYGADMRRPLYAIVSTFPADTFVFTQALKLEE
jgi:DNA-binding GntR family transcriptional regulator